MTRSDFSAWLAARSPKPPPALADRLAQQVVAAPDGAFAGGSMAVVAGRLGIATLHATLERQAAPPVASGAAGAGGDRAISLLAADAFVTYAFEAAALEGGDVSDLAWRLLAETNS